MKFVEAENGLYYHDAASPVTANSTIIDYTFLKTVAQNKAQFTRREIAGVD